MVLHVVKNHVHFFAESLKNCKISEVKTYGLGWTLGCEL